MTGALRAMVRGRLLALVALLVLATPAFAAPSFPSLTGRVVDGANILSPQIEAELTAKLAALEAATRRQLVVATLADLQGYEIEEYGYQLGRAWAIGREGVNDGALLLVAPAERKVRVEIGYGLEGVLTDALSNVILQTKVLPRFKDGDMPGGVVAGTDALIEQLSLDASEAQQRIASAQSEAASDDGFDPEAFIFIVVLVLWLVFGVMRSRRRGGFGWVPPVVFGGGSGTRWSDRDGGGWGGGGGGGGFSGGGGSFGGGGASGSW